MNKRMFEIYMPFAVGIAVGTFIKWMIMKKEIGAMKIKLNRTDEFYNLTMHWLILHQDGQNLSEYFKRNNYKTIAIYGMGYLGERLVAELHGTDIEVSYIVDQNADNIYAKIQKYKPTNELPQVDVMVVTAIVSFYNIQEEMEKKVCMPIISLEDVVYGLA